MVLASLGPQTTSEPQSLSPGGPRQSQQLAAKSPPTQIRAQSLNAGSFPGTDNTSRADRKKGAALQTSTELKGEGANSSPVTLNTSQSLFRNTKQTTQSEKVVLEREHENKKSKEEVKKRTQQFV